MAKRESDVAEVPVKKPLDLHLVGQIAQGILSGPNVSHREPENVAKLAVAQARAITNAVDAENA